MDSPFSRSSVVAGACTHMWWDSAELQLGSGCLSARLCARTGTQKAISWGGSLISQPLGSPVTSFIMPPQSHQVLPALLNPTSQCVVGKVKQTGSKRADEKHPHLSFLYLLPLVCLKFSPNHSAVRGMLYLSADKVKDRSHIPEMQKLQCSSACGGKQKMGYWWWRPTCYRQHFPILYHKALHYHYFLQV